MLPVARARIGALGLHGGGHMRKLRRVAGVVLVGLVSALLAVAAAQPAHADGPLTLVNQQNSGFCLQPEGEYYGALVRQSPCVPGQVNQQWYTIGTGTPGYFLLQNAASGHLCLDARDGIDANGTLIQLWGCNGSASMTWRRSNVYLNIYKVQSKIGYKCLDGWDPYAYPPRTKLWTCTNGSSNYSRFTVAHIRGHQVAAPHA
jgi:hypothetical protein